MQVCIFWWRKMKTSLMPIFECEAEIKAETSKRNLIATTHICMVSELIAKDNEKPKFVKVNDLKELDKLRTFKRQNTYEDETNKINRCQTTKKRRKWP